MADHSAYVVPENPFTYPVHLTISAVLGLHGNNRLVYFSSCTGPVLGYRPSLTIFFPKIEQQLLSWRSEVHNVRSTQSQDGCARGAEVAHRVTANVKYRGLCLLRQR